MDVRPEEAYIYNYWLITLRLLKIGLPWDYIASIHENELMMILGVQLALEQKEAEDQQAEMHSMKGNVNF